MPCFYAREGRKKGCRKPAVYRVILGDGSFHNVCEKHIEVYKGLGYKIVELVKV